MVKNFWSQFCFLAAGAVKKTVINDEDIFSAVIRQTFDVVIYDIRSKKRSETSQFVFAELRKR